MLKPSMLKPSMLKPVFARQRFTTFILASSFLLVSCAPPPSDIEAAKVPTAKYSKMNCRELLEEREVEIDELEKLSRTQSNKRAWSIGLNLLIIPGAGKLTGDKKIEIGQAKGKIIAIQDELERRCIKDDEEINEEIESRKEEISHYFYFDPDSGVNRAISQLKETYGFSEDSQKGEGVLHN